MSHIYTIDEIAALVKPVAERYGIERVWLFGSYARGEATEDSDVDLMLTYEKLKGLFAYGGLYVDFAEALGKSVDIVTERSLSSPYANEPSKKLYNNIRKECIKIYGR